MASLSAIEAVVRTLTPTVFRLYIPFKTYFSEALAAAEWAKGDKAALLKKNFNWDLVEEMPLRVELAQKADGTWNAARFAHNAEANREWDEKYPEALEVREELLADMDLAYADNPDMCQRISEVKEGTGKPDFVQDFFDMVALCRSLPQPMLAIGYDIAQLEAVEVLASDLARIVSLASNEKLEASAELLFRNQALTHVDTALRQIRLYGHRVARNNPERLLGYQSAAARKRGKAARAAAAKEAEQKAAAAAAAAAKQNSSDPYGE